MNKISLVTAEEAKKNHDDDLLNQNVASRLADLSHGLVLKSRVPV